MMAPNEVPKIGRPMRVVFAAGGAYMFYYGTDPNVPETVQGFAVLFTILGIAAVVFAIFSQKIAELRAFSNIYREGGFPSEIEAGEAGILIKYKTTDYSSGTDKIDVNEKERYYFYSQVGAINDFGEYFKLGLKGGGHTGRSPVGSNPSALFIFKEDFGQGEPEAFKSFIKSKTV